MKQKNFFWLLCILSPQYKSRIYQLLLIIVYTCRSLYLKHSATGYPMASSFLSSRSHPKGCPFPNEVFPDPPSNERLCLSGHSLLHHLALFFFWHLHCLFISLVIVYLLVMKAPCRLGIVCQSSLYCHPHPEHSPRHRTACGSQVPRRL